MDNEQDEVQENDAKQKKSPQIGVSNTIDRFKQGKQLINQAKNLKNIKNLGSIASAGEVGAGAATGGAASAAAVGLKVGAKVTKGSYDKVKGALTPHYHTPEEEEKERQKKGKNKTGLVDKINQGSDLIKNVRKANNFRKGLQAARTAGQAGEMAGEAMGAAEGATGAASLAGGAAGGGAAAGAAGAAGGAGAAAAGGTAVVAAESNPIGWIITAAVIIFIILVILLFIIIKHFHAKDDNSNTPTTSTGAIPGLTLHKEGNTTVANGSNITYKITASYTGTSDIIIHDPIPANTTFVSATGNFIKITDNNNNVTEIQWSLTPTIITTASTTTNSVSYQTYTQAPYFLPPSTGQSDVSYSADQMSGLNQLGSIISQHQSYLLSKVNNGNPKFVDPFLSVIWNGAIEGIGGSHYEWNCLDKGTPISQGCAGGFSSGGWQVGWGAQVSQATGHLAEDFDEIYGAGSSQNAAKVQQVGQAVIDNSNGKVNNPQQFPKQSVQALVNSAQSGQQNAQQAIAVLLMDPQVGAIALAREVAGDIESRDNWRATMEGWGSYYSSHMQEFANRANALTQSYTGSSGNTGNNSSTAEPINKTYTLVVKPQPNSNIENQAWAEVAGSDNSTGSTQPISSGNEPPNSDTCNGYYSLYNSLGLNFGDPQCTFLPLRRPADKDKLFTLIQQMDPQHANDWFFNIIPCESGFNANAYASPASGTPDPIGAWGLFQMGRGRNGDYDHGDVAWEKQTSNAINYNNQLIQNGAAWRYWACAEYLWGTTR